MVFHVLNRGVGRMLLFEKDGDYEAFEHVLHFVDPRLTFAEVAASGGFACPAFAEATKESTCVLLPAEPFTRR